MADEANKNGIPEEPASESALEGDSAVSRLDLLKTGGAFAVGAGLGALAGPAGALGATDHSEALLVPTSLPMGPASNATISLTGTHLDLQKLILSNATLERQAGLKGSPVGSLAVRSQILQAAYSNLLLANAAKIAKAGPSFTLDFSLHFTLFAW